MAALVVVVIGAMAVLIPARWPDRIGLLLVALAAAWFLRRLGLVRVEVDDDGVTVVNVLRSRRLGWGELLAVRFGGGDPWMYLETANDETIAAMGVQRADGDHARADAQFLANLVASR
jgi:hypothetical protein